MPDRESQKGADKRPVPDKPQDKTERQALQGEQPNVPQKMWDIIDERAWESFPASDPPATWAGRDLTPEEREATKAKAKPRKGREPS